MRHSFQMREELDFMAERAGAFHDQAFSNFSENYDRVLILHRQELMEYKIKLEELLEETDIKEQSIKKDFLMLLKINFPILTAFKEEQTYTMHLLLDVEHLLSDTGSDDYERYAKMGLKIDPEDPGFLQRKGNCN